MPCRTQKCTKCGHSFKPTLRASRLRTKVAKVMEQIEQHGGDAVFLMRLPHNGEERLHVTMHISAVGPVGLAFKQQVEQDMSWKNCCTSTYPTSSAKFVPISGVPHGQGYNPSFQLGSSKPVLGSAMVANRGPVQAAHSYSPRAASASMASNMRAEVLCGPYEPPGFGHTGGGPQDLSSKRKYAHKQASRSRNVRARTSVAAKTQQGDDDDFEPAV